MAFSSDELEALQSIYCAQDELEVLSQSPTCILQFNLKASTSTADFPFSLTLEMDDKYPDGQDSCQMSLQCTALNRGQRDILMEKTKEFAASELLGSPMIMEIISFVRDNLGSFLDSTSPENSCLQPDLDQALPPTNQDQKRLLLIELDHMRDVKGYSQTLAKWTKQLGLSGRLVFTRGYQLPRGVLILVIGEECQTREFEKRLRTTKVDVDSQGRPCKEKMLRILCCRDWDVSEAEESSRGTLITSSLEELVVAMPELSEVLDQHVKK